MHVWALDDENLFRVPLTSSCLFWAASASAFLATAAHSPLHRCSCWSSLCWSWLSCRTCCDAASCFLCSPWRSLCCACTAHARSGTGVVHSLFVVALLG